MAIAMTVLDRLVRVPAPTNTSHCEAAAALSETPSRAASFPDPWRSNFPRPSMGALSQQSPLRLIEGVIPCRAGAER